MYIICGCSVTFKKCVLIKYVTKWKHSVVVSCLLIVLRLTKDYYIFLSTNMNVVSCYEYGLCCILNILLSANIIHVTVYDTSGAILEHYYYYYYYYYTLMLVNQYQYMHCSLMFIIVIIHA